MDWLSAIGGAVFGAIVGGLGTMLMPLRWRLAALGRRMLEEPVLTTVDTDLDVIHAGVPDWVGFSFYIRSIPQGEPPNTRSGWQSWVYHRGGYDMGLSTVLITLVARSEATVVIRPPVVNVRGPIPLEGSGIELVRPVGGAAVKHLGFDVYLDSHPEVVKLTDIEDEEDLPKSWALTKGEVLDLHLRAMVAQAGLWKWTAEIPILIDGRRSSISVTREGGSFLVVGSESQVTKYMWHDERWMARGELDGSV